MNRKFQPYCLLLSIMLVIVPIMVDAQVDSVKLKLYTPGFRFNEGLYLTHYQMVNNKPISLQRVLTNYNKHDFDFFEKLLSEESVMFYDEFGLKKVVAVSDLRGFCRRGSLYVNWGDDFSKITVVGSICHFVSSVTYVENQSFQSANASSYYNTPSPTSRIELRQYIMDFISGKIVDYHYENVLILLMNDKELFDEFNGLKKKKKKELKFLYVRKFNEKHKLYIPIN